VPIDKTIFMPIEKTIFMPIGMIYQQNNFHAKLELFTLGMQRAPMARRSNITSYYSFGETDGK
jgi:hypothetical protein